MEKYLNDKRIDNTWSVIKLSDLPDNMPILTIQEFRSKDLAEFHLVEYCLIPKSLLNTSPSSKTEGDAAGE